MKIIIAGVGKAGIALAKQLSAEGYDLILIDSNSQILESAIENYDVMTVCGNCAAKDTLVHADIAEAQLLIAVTSEDEVNLLCCMTAHGLNPNIHTIARIRNPEYSDQIYEMSHLFAISMAVNPEKQAASEIERLLKLPGFLRRDSFAKGLVEIVEFLVGSNNRLCDVALGDMAGIVKCSVLVCAVLRNGESITPDGNFVIKEGDRLFVTASTNDLAKLLKNIGIITHKVRRVMICGGSRTGIYLASALTRSGIDVEIIEQDHARCVMLANLLPKATIVCGDSSNQALLESEGINDCDALVTLTGLDELNMIISMYGIQQGVKQVVTKLGHLDSSSIISNLSIGSTISPKELCCNTIVSYVRAIKNQKGGSVSVHHIADGQAEAVEFLIDEEALNCGVPLKDLHLKQNVRFACIIHGSKAEIPNGSSHYNPGDTVVIVTGGSLVISQFNDIFE